MRPAENRAMSAPSAQRTASPATAVTPRPSYSDTAPASCRHHPIHCPPSRRPRGSRFVPGSRPRHSTRIAFRVTDCGGKSAGAAWEWCTKPTQLDLKHIVAVKFLHPAAPFGPEQSARFRAEAEAAARLHHPNIVGVHDRGEVAGRLYLVMEFVPGENLAVRLVHAAADTARCSPSDCDIGPGRGFRPPAWCNPPRPEAGQHPDDSGREAQNHRLRIGQNP